jgi:hypothetical protein
MILIPDAKKLNSRKPIEVKTFLVMSNKKSALIWGRKVKAPSENLIFARKK